MRKKTLIQLFLLIFLILFSYFILTKYFNTSTIDNNLSNITTTITAKDKNADEKIDLLKDLKYKSNNIKGDSYELDADYGESILEKSNSMFLTNVKGRIVFKDDKKPNIILTSKFANFNTVTFETTFIDDVKIMRTNEIITGDELYLVLDHDEENSNNTTQLSKEKNLIRMSYNIFFKKPGYTLKADILEIDLITKNMKIYMNNNSKKVKVTSLIN
jgi:hypothetical protein